MATITSALRPVLNETVEKLKADFDVIPGERRRLLQSFANIISEIILRSGEANLNFICTHNSRRSHIAQLWAQTAAYHYGVKHVHTFSGGTEATAFNPRAVKAMQEAGFEIRKRSDGNNPVYEARISDEAPPVTTFSKKYDDPFNPAAEFVAIMTCSHADENCPVVSGASKRISITYDDPKTFDDTVEEEKKYKERVMQIGREMLYAFSRVK